SCKRPIVRADPLQAGNVLDDDIIRHPSLDKAPELAQQVAPGIGFLQRPVLLRERLARSAAAEYGRTLQSVEKRFQYLDGYVPDVIFDEHRRADVLHECLCGIRIKVETENDLHPCGCKAVGCAPASGKEIEDL